MARAIMKRFAWLWGALLGAVLLPLLMVACHHVVAGFLPSPLSVTIGSPNLSLLLQVLSLVEGHWGAWGSGLGCCGALLWAGERSLKWRLLSIGVGTGTMSYLLWVFRGLWYSLYFNPKHGDTQLCYLLAATSAPLTLASLLLIFFALLMRTSPTSATKP